MTGRRVVQVTGLLLAVVVVVVVALGVVWANWSRAADGGLIAGVMAVVGLVLVAIIGGAGAIVWAVTRERH